MFAAKNILLTASVAPPPGGFDVLALSPRLWLDASDSSTLLDGSSLPTGSGGVIETWSDKSGNSNHATRPITNRPTRAVAYQNGLDAVFFDANVIARMGFASSPLSGATAAFVAFVAKRVDNTPPNGFTSTSPVAQFGSDSSGDHYSWSDGNIYDGFASNTRKTCGNPTPSLDVANVVSIVSGPSDYRYRIAGSVLYSTSSNTVGIGTSPTLGYFAAQNWSYYGHLMEVLMLNYVPTAGQITDIESYLSTKWGL